MNNLTTICDLLYQQNNNFKKENFLNYKTARKLKSFSNQEFFDKALQFSCGLKELNIKPKSILANFSYQNPIWLIVDFGAILADLITTPIFHNISKDNLIYQIKDSDSQVIFSDNLSSIDILEIHNSKIKIIYFNNYDKALDNFKKENIISFDEVIRIGKKALDDKKYNFSKLSQKIKSHNIATIIYTSGSTGNPKGVEITHHNLISQINATKTFFPLKENDVAISYLPLAHIFERMVVMYYISQGVSIYFIDNVKKISIYLQQFKPNLITTVPRVLEKIYQGISFKIDSSSFFSKIIGKLAVKRALTKNTNHKNFIDKVYDNLVYKKFRYALGGKIDMIICGGSPISNDMERFFINIGFNLYVGYGMTETSPVIAANCPLYNKFSTVGKAYPDVQLKISKDKELLVKGPNVMNTYHNNPQATKEVIDNEGWLKTGDLAEIDKDGFVKIIGRKKELFKTAYGKYVVPIPIEQQLAQKLDFVIGVLLIAESKNFVSVLIFPDFENLKKIKEKLDYKSSDRIFLKSDILKQFTQEKIDDLNLNLNKWEMIRKFAIITDKISIESGEITPSMKLKRSLLEKKYQKLIDDFYLTPKT